MTYRFFVWRIALLVVMLFVMLTSPYAAPRTVKQAQKEAARLINKHMSHPFLGLKGTVATCPDPQLVYTRACVDKQEAYYYVFSSGKDQGFVIVSGDDRLPPIVGYSTSGNYEPDNMPKSLIGFMQDYCELMDGLTEQKMQGIQSWKAQALQWDEVKPLVTTKWNQYEPYNNFCPEYYPGKRSVTGCASTAAAQILYYYRQPDWLMADIPSYTIQLYGMVMPTIKAGEIYDWDNMLDTYKSNTSKVNQDAVAKLMLHVGCAAHAEYGEETSGLLESEDFIRFFGMDKELCVDIFRQNYTLEEWNAILYDELKSGRPVFYIGASTYLSHAFVIHGFRDGLFYVNWGWGGAHDGYYDITVLDPGYRPSTGGFSAHGSMILGLQPDNGVVDKVYRSRLYAEFKPLKSIILSGDNLKATVDVELYNGSEKEQTLLLNLAYTDDKGVQHLISTTREQYFTEKYWPEHLSFDIEMNVEEGKTYRLYPVESTDGENWLKSCHYLSNKDDLVVTIKNSHVETPVEAILTAKAEFGSPHGGFTERENVIDVKLSNSGDKEYYGIVHVRAGNGNEMMPVKDIHSCGVTLLPHETITLKVSYTPNEAGTHSFWILAEDKSENKNEIGKSSLTFQSYMAPDLSLVSIKCSNASQDNICARYLGYDVLVNKVYDTSAEMEFTICNKGGFVEAPVRLYRYNKGISYGSWKILSDTILLIPSNSTQTFKAVVSGEVGDVVGLKIKSDDYPIAKLKDTNKHSGPSGDYIELNDAEICYLAGKSVDMNLIKDDERNDGVYYDLMGKRVVRPVKGVYIRKGKKYVIK